MSTSSPERDLVEKHEEILGRRAELMERMEGGRNQSSRLRMEERREERREEARCRNACLLQEVRRVEERLRGRKLPPPSLLALETRYWASVEESLPAWELFLLGKGPHPTDGGQRPARTGHPSPAKDQSRPPLPGIRSRR